MEEPRIKSPTFILFPLFRSRKNNKLGHGSSVPDLHLLIRKRKQEKKNALTNDYLYHYKVKQNKIYISLSKRSKNIVGSYTNSTTNWEFTDQTNFNSPLKFARQSHLYCLLKLPKVGEL